MENLATTYVHHMNPFAIQFTETIGIRWYGLAYLAGFIVCYFLLLRMSKRGTIPIKPEELGDFVTACAIGTLLGGRLGYATFYQPDLWWTFHSSFPFWGVLEVHKGGMASHGGIFGLFCGCWVFSRMKGYNKLHLLDLTCFGFMGVFFGRLANFVNGELYGRQAPEGYKWAVKFPSELYRWLTNEPDKLERLGPVVEKLSPFHYGGREIAVSASQWSDWVKWKDATARVNIESTISYIMAKVESGSQEMLNFLEPVLTPRYPSQIYQGLMEGLIVFVVVCWLWRKPQKPGVVAGLAGLTYAIMRIVGEQFRMPDAHIGYEFLGLTRGQWLSVAMVGVAVALTIYSYKRRDTEPMGGWS